MICSRSSNSCYFIQNCIANVEVPTFVGGGGGRPAWTYIWPCLAIAISCHGRQETEIV